MFDGYWERQQATGLLTSAVEAIPVRQSPSERIEAYSSALQNDSPSRFCNSTATALRFIGGPPNQEEPSLWLPKTSAWITPKNLFGSLD
jgi:hypothetical protein